MGSAMTKPSIIAPLRRVDLILIFVAVKGLARCGGEN
jgi:hypothetical protein